MHLPAIDLVTAEPVAPQYYELKQDGFTAILVRVGPVAAVIVVQVAFFLNPAGCIGVNFLSRGVVRLPSAMMALFADTDAGRELRREEMKLLMDEMHLLRLNVQQSYMAPFGQKTGEA